MAKKPLLACCVISLYENACLKGINQSNVIEYVEYECAMQFGLWPSAGLFYL